MKFSIVKIGRSSSQEIPVLIDRYARRLKGFAPTEILQVKDTAIFEKRGPDSSELWILLDEKGKELTTEKFAKQIELWNGDPQIKSIIFFVGGPYGFSDKLLGKKHEKIALSQFTFPSEIAWLLVIEQLYRAMTILKGMDYHHA